MPQANYHTSRITAASTITLPRANMWLAFVRVEAGSTAAAWQYRYNGSAQALFMAPSNGTRGTRTYKMRQQIAGTTIPSGTQTVTGGLAFVELIFTADPPSAGKSWDDLRGVVAQRVDAGATSAAVTFTYDVAPAAPKAVEAYISASAGRVVFPSIDNLTGQVEAICTEVGTDERNLIPTPPFSPSNTLAPSVNTDGAATIIVGLYY